MRATTLVVQQAWERTAVHMSSKARLRQRTPSDNRQLCVRKLFATARRLCRKLTRVPYLNLLSQRLRTTAVAAK